jgi:hypothetical protein
MKLFGRKLSTYAQVLLVLVPIFLVASGLCGMMNFDSGGNSGFLVALWVVGGIAMIPSGVGILLVIFLWAGTAIRKRLRRPASDHVQGLFDKQGETNHDEEQ